MILNGWSNGIYARKPKPKLLGVKPQQAIIGGEGVRPDRTQNHYSSVAYILQVVSTHTLTHTQIVDFSGQLRIVDGEPRKGFFRFLSDRQAE
jgi:hypothetical protein